MSLGLVLLCGQIWTAIREHRKHGFYAWNYPISWLLFEGATAVGYQLGHPFLSFAVLLWGLDFAVGRISLRAFGVSVGEAQTEEPPSG